MVLDRVRHAEDLEEAGSIGQALAGCELVRVWVDNEVGRVAGGDDEEAGGDVAPVRKLVGAARAAEEGEHVAWHELAPVSVGADARAPEQHDEELFLAQVVVIRIGGLAGLDLPDAGTESLRGELPAEPRSQGPEAGVLASLVKSGSKMFGMGARFAPPPRDPLPVVKCGHGPATPRRPVPRAGCARRALLVGIVLAGCGGSSKASAAAGAAGTDGRGAQAFPASTVAFADANIDQKSDAWKRLLTLGERFPSWPKVVAEFDKAANRATDGGPTLAQLRSWLGGEVAVGVLDVPADGSDPTVLAFAEVTDKRGLEDALKQEKTVHAAGAHGGFDLFESNEGRAVVAVSDDAALAANSASAVTAAIDRLASPSDRLSDSADFNDTMATLPNDNIVVGYAPGSTLQKLVTLSQRSGPEATRGQLPRRRSTRSRRSWPASAASASR